MCERVTVVTINGSYLLCATAKGSCDEDRGVAPKLSPPSLPLPPPSK